MFSLHVLQLGQAASVALQEEDFKLMFGLFWSLRALATAVDPKK